MSIGTTKAPFLPAAWLMTHGLTFYDMGESIRVVREAGANHDELQMMVTTATSFLYTEANYAIEWPALVRKFFEEFGDIHSVETYLKYCETASVKIREELKLAMPRGRNQPETLLTHISMAGATALRVHEDTVAWFTEMMQNGASDKSGVMNIILSYTVNMLNCIASLHVCTLEHLKLLAEKG